MSIKVRGLKHVFHDYASHNMYNQHQKNNDYMYTSIENDDIRYVSVSSG